MRLLLYATIRGDIRMIICKRHKKMHMSNTRGWSVNGTGAVGRNVRGSNAASYAYDRRRLFRMKPTPARGVSKMWVALGPRTRKGPRVIAVRVRWGSNANVRYIATEEGETNPIALPEMRTAYLMMGDVFPKDW